jgi:hypothetical protein
MLAAGEQQNGYPGGTQGLKQIAVNTTQPYPRAMIFLFF